jgi:hypothetical protein
MQYTRTFVIGATLAALAIAQTPIATVSPTPQLQFFDNNGKPLSGGQLCTYAAGTTTPLTSYKDAIGTPNTNPIVLDSSGRANVWIGAVAYKFVLRMKGSPMNCTAGTVLYTVDGVIDQGYKLRSDLAGTNGGTNVGFQPPGGTSSTVEAALLLCAYSSQYPTLTRALSNIPASGCLNIDNANTVSTNIAIAANGVTLHVLPGGSITAGAGNLKVLTFSGDSQSVICDRGATFNGGAPLTGVVMIAAANATNFRVDGCLFQNVGAAGTQGAAGVAISGVGATVTISNSHFNSFGNGTYATSDGCDGIVSTDFTRITLERNSFKSNTTGDFIHIFNTAASPITASLIDHANWGTQIGRMALEVQMQVGSIQESDNHWDTLIAAGCTANLCEGESLGIVQGNTPTAPQQPSSSVKGLHVEIPGGASGFIGSTIGLEIYINGVAIEGLQVIGPWANGVLMGSQNVRCTACLFDHNIKGIVENGSSSGTGHQTDHLRLINPVFNESRDQDIIIGSFDNGDDDIEGMHSIRNCASWPGDNGRSWLNMGFGLGGQAPAALRPVKLINSVVTLNNNPGSCTGFSATGLFLVTQQAPGSLIDNYSIQNEQAVPFGTAYNENGAGFYSGTTIINSNYMNLASMGNVNANDALLYGNNKCSQGLNPNACGTAGGPAVNWTVIHSGRPTVVCGAGAGAGSTCTIGAQWTDKNFQLNVTTAGTPASNTSVANVTFAQAFRSPNSLTCHFTFAGANPVATLASATSLYTSPVSTTQWNLGVQNTALASGVAYSWFVSCADSQEVSQQ